MKKNVFTLLAVFCIFSIHSSAQKASRFGIQAGATYSNLTVGYDGETESGDYKPGFTAGIMLDKQIGKSFYLQPALNFVQKGFHEKSSYSGEKSTITFAYIELPVNFVYRKKQESGFFIGGGPSLGCGIGGTSKIGDEKEPIHFGGEGNGDLFELEANLLAGYMFPGKFQVSVNYNFGITSLTDDSSVKMKNNYFGLRLGYYFKK